MRKALLPILSLACLAWLCMSVQAQQGNERAQPSALPPPIAVDAKQVEQATSVAPPKRVVRACYGDPKGMVRSANTSYEVVKQEPVTGIKIEGYPSPKMPERGGTTDSAKDVWTRYLVIFKDVKYTVMVDLNRVIKHVGTDDERFASPDGLRVGDRLEKVLKASDGTPPLVSGCLYDYKLKSGWHAVIGMQYILEDGSLAEDAKVTDFFKRD